MSGTTTPVVFPDLDPVLMMRVHPEAESVAELDAAAVAQGTATAEAGADLQASQQDPGKPPEAPPVDVPPPVNVDVPYVSQAGSTLSCTMGNWVVTPDSYSYAWQINGNAAGTNAASYAVQAGDIGGTATCVVTATNAAGSTAAPPSNAITVT